MRDKYRAHYRDHRGLLPIDPNEQCCTIKEWLEGAAPEAPCARHAGGFLVFLPPEVLEKDEYSEGDPYAMQQNSNSQFHENRLSLTLELCSQAIGGKPSRVLDLGCGVGLITRALQSALPAGSEVTGLDYSLGAIEQAAAASEGIEYVVADAYSPPFAEGYFDLLVMNNLWEHVPDPLLLLSGASRVLRAGGCIIISTPSRYRTGNLLRALAGKPLRFVSPLHVTEYSVGQVVEQLHYGGFHVERIASRPLEGSWSSLKDMALHRVLAPLLRAMLWVTGSIHKLDATVFYLARKIDK